MKNRKRNTSYAKQFQKWQKNLGPARGSLLILVIIIGALIGVKQVQVHRERTTYRAAERQVETLVENASKLAPSSNKVRKYCRYSSVKYGKGYLSCTVSGSVTYEAMSDDRLNEVIKLIDSTHKPKGWLFVRDNTWNYSDLPKTEIKNTIYKSAQLSCGVRYSFVVNDSQQIVTIGEKRLLRVAADCTGAALKEYYPVVDY